jgi:hypothetical protein
MVRLSSGQDVVRALAAARDVEVLAYTLRLGPVLAGLQAAARRGARVRVRLEGAPFNDPKAALARRNRQIVGELAECGADAQLVDSDGTGIPLHAKALLTDGRLFLDDRNFGASDFVIRDSDPSAARAVREIFSGDEPAPNSPSFSIEKAKVSVTVRFAVPWTDSQSSAFPCGCWSPVAKPQQAGASAWRSSAWQTTALRCAFARIRRSTRSLADARGWDRPTLRRRSAVQ